ncbi:hypothetical protein BJ170DRAFT_447652 [Xylariales sp. AK1849]|nr:hypothetical protein BJ170DRAFT_447652 [Xylariales sp. AK1849]
MMIDFFQEGIAPYLTMHLQCPILLLHAALKTTPTPPSPLHLHHTYLTLEVESRQRKKHFERRNQGKSGHRIISTQQDLLKNVLHEEDTRLIQQTDTSSILHNLLKNLPSVVIFYSATLTEMKGLHDNCSAIKFGRLAKSGKGGDIVKFDLTRSTARRSRSRYTRLISCMKHCPITRSAYRLSYATQLNLNKDVPDQMVSSGTSYVQETLVLKEARRSAWFHLHMQAI